MGDRRVEGDFEGLGRTRHDWAPRIARRYVPPGLVAQYAARNDVPGELVVRITPTRWVARASMAGRGRRRGR